MKNFVKGLFGILILFLLFSCRNNQEENSRAYVEGKVTPFVEKFSIQILNKNTVAAQTGINAAGEFVASGPIETEGFTLHFSHKIENFKTDAAGLSLSTDQYNILVPKGLTYVKFSEIKIKP